MVGVHQRVVVTIDDTFAAAIVQGIAFAHRSKPFVLFWITLEIFRPMTAHLVQHQHGVFIQGVDEVLQTLQENFIAALAVGAQRRVFQIADILERDSITRAFAARLVIAPDHIKTRALEHIQQAFFVLCLAGVVILAPHVGKHARHRHRGFRAAGMHIGKRDKACLLVQLRRGITVVPQHAKVLGTGTFTHHQYGQGFSAMGLPDRVFLRILTDLDEGLLGRRDLFAHITERGTHVVAGHYHQTQLVVITEQRRQPLIVTQCDTTDHRHRSNSHQHFT
ncbi:hypothetical protein D3C73_1090490 [compost metagenome]